MPIQQQPKDDTTSRASMTQTAGGPPAAAWSQQQQTSIFSIPAPLKRIFDKFPLVQYEGNDSPMRGPASKSQHVLHVFTTEKDAKNGKPSFNPGCLKWQTYLNFSGIKYKVVPSSNHGSPSGILPFIQPATSGSDPSDPTNAPAAVPGHKLRKWAQAQSSEHIEEPEDLRYEAYSTLVSNALRKAWLYQLYIHPSNSTLLHSLYVAPCSSHAFVQLAITHQLRAAAEKELAKSSFSSTISEADVMHDASNAITALSELLGKDQWFFGQEQPSMLDASVFAYTQLILDDGLQWGQNELARLISDYPNLVEHRDRILNKFY